MGRGFLKLIQLTKYGLVILGAHFGVHILKDLKKNQGKNILLVEPVPYNIKMLKDNTRNYHNIIIEHTAIGSNNETKDFYFVKGDSIHKLGKHWASGIGSFNKEHILNHRSKRFEIKEIDIAKIKINCLNFMSLAEKYSISEIEKLQIDTEGSEYEILKSIDYKKIEIKNILFESKHFDGTFQEGEKLKEIEKLLKKNKYLVEKIDKENFLAKKN